MVATNGPTPTETKAVGKGPNVPKAEQHQQDDTGSNGGAHRRPGDAGQHDVGVARHTERERQERKDRDALPVLSTVSFSSPDQTIRCSAAGVISRTTASAIDRSESP